VRFALILTVTSLLGYVVVVLGYALGSYGIAKLAQRHLRRPLLVSAAELAREIGWVLVSQPLLPLMYFVGRRLTGGRGVPVVVVHGYFQNRVSFLYLGRALGRRLGVPVYGINYPWMLPVEDNGARLARFVAEVLAETGAREVDLVCHSMGGLVGRAALARGASIRRLVTIASPHAGVTYRGPIVGQGGRDLIEGSALLAKLGGHRIPVPALSVYSSADNVVYPVRTSQLSHLSEHVTSADLVVGEMGHLAILFATSTADAVEAFLGKDHETPVGSGAMADPEDDVSALVTRARRAQSAWADKPVEARVKALAPLKGRILSAAERIAKTVHDEVGKPEVEAIMGEVLPSADVVAYWCEQIPELLEPVEAELDPLAYGGKTAWTRREPRGVVALIQPWNFPFALPLRTLVPALLAGNAVVFKPSEVSPKCGALVVELLSGLVPDGLVVLAEGDGAVGAALCAAEVDVVVFTGSVATGKKVAHACAERLVPCALELGGKDAAIALADCDLERTANGIVWGGLLNAGQNCASIERVYVEKAIAKELTDKIVAKVKALKKGVDVGPLSTAAQRATVERHVAAAKEAGAEILCGGEPGDGNAFDATVVSVEGDDSALMTEETFGPVLPIRVVASADEAIELANKSRYGLTASVWSKDTARAEKLARRLRAGVVTINNHGFTGALPQAPWSGVGETGWGITSSPHALDTLTHPRFVLVDRSRAKKELWWYPYTPTLRTIGLAMAKLRGGAKGVGDFFGALFALLGAMPRRLGGKDEGEARG
jgi:acyl-CoA reductase-like NAD-dependent aldehyde dehydrogenase